MTARSALGVRLVLSLLFIPVFLAGTALFWYWTVNSGPRDVPSSDSLRTLTIICAVLAVLALIDLLVVVRRRRGARQRGPRTR